MYLLVRTTGSILLMAAVAALSANPAAAIPRFSQAFQEKYVKVGSSNANEAKFAGLAQAAKCNVCHIQGQAKKARNAYGAQLDLLLDKANFKPARLKANPDQVKQELDAALDKVAAMHSDPKNPNSPTFGELIAAGSLPSNGVAVQLAQAAPAIAEQPKSDTPKTEPAKPEPAKTESAKTEPAKEVAKPEATKAEPAKVEVAKSEPPKTEPPKTEAPKPEPPKTEPPKPEPAKVATPQPEKTQPAAAKVETSRPTTPAPAKVAVTFPPAVDAGTEQAAVAAINSAGGTVREVAQNDDSKEIDFHLGGTALTDAGLAHVKSVNKVVQLHLKDTQITDAGLASIAGMTGLRRLHLEKTKITDAGLAHLKDLAGLEYLNLYGTAVTDAGLEQLKGLKNLRQLYVWQTKVTDDGIKKLKEALPSVEVVK